MGRGGAAGAAGGGDGKKSKGGLIAGLQEIYEDALSYRTFKVVKIRDKRLATLHKTLVLGVVLWATLSIIITHAYMITETPHITANFWVDSYMEGSSFNESQASYCNNPLTDYTYSSTFIYTNLQCVTFLDNNQIARKADAGMWVLTQFSETTYNRTCEYERSGTNAFPKGCRRNVVGSGNAFVADVSSMTISFTASYVATWGEAGIPDEITIENPDNSDLSFTFKDEVPTVKLSDLMVMAGLDLDSPNEYSGGAGPPWPLFRLTGGRITLFTELENFRTTSPFDFSVKATITPSLSSRGAWVGPGGEVLHSGIPVGRLGEVDTTYSMRYWQGIYLEAVSTGLIGTFDYGMLMDALIQAAVLVGVATSLVDLMGAFVLDTFKDDKFEDDEERKGLEKMLVLLETTGLPFEMKVLYEQLVVDDGQGFEDAIESNQRAIKELQMTNLELQKGIEDMGGKVGKRPAERMVPDLIGPRVLCENGHVIALASGQELHMGRGTGGVERKDISRKLLSVKLSEDGTTLTLSPLAMAGRSKWPGVRRANSKTWESMPQNGAKLTKEDQFCLYYAQGGTEPPVGVFTFQTTAEPATGFASWFC